MSEARRIEHIGDAALERIEIAYRQPRLFDEPKKVPEPQNFNFPLDAPQKRGMI